MGHIRQYPRRITARIPVDIGGPYAVARSKHLRFAAPLVNVLLVVLTLPWFLTSIPRTAIHCASRALVVYVVALVFSVICANAGGEGQEALYCWLPIIVLCPVTVFVVDTIKT